MKEYTTKEFARAVSRVLSEAEGDSVIIHRRGKPDIELRRYIPEVHTSEVEVHTSAEKVHTSGEVSPSEDSYEDRLSRARKALEVAEIKARPLEEKPEVRYKWEDGTCHKVTKEEIQGRFGKRWESIWEGLPTHE